MTPDERVTLRKIWEVGTETVMLQTTIQLDGDVLTRLRPFRDDTDAARYERLHTLHREGVETALATWQTLIDTAVRFVGLFTGGTGVGRPR